MLHALQPRSSHFKVKRLILATQRSLRWPCRCRHKACEQRATLAKHPEAYVRPARCPSCRRRGTMRVDWFRVVKEWHARPCRCFGYSFPHARGRGYCEHNARLTADDLREREESRRWA